MNRLLLLLLFPALLGCPTAPNDPVVIQKNAATFAADPEVVAVLPDGSRVVRYRVDRGSQDEHWVYLVDNRAAITLNYTEVTSNGKTQTRTPHVEVLVDGVKFVPMAEQPE